MKCKLGHFCKECGTMFSIKIHENETGDFILICPICKKQHYRYFENGIAIHCDIIKRKNEPLRIYGN